MKKGILAIVIISVLAVTMCTSNNTPNYPNNGSFGPIPDNTPQTNDYCGVSVKMASPSEKEIISGGFRVEWTLQDDSNMNFVNKQANFTVYMRNDTVRTDYKRIVRYYGQTYKEDITFLNAVPKGKYVVGIEGWIQGCRIHAAEANVTVN